MVTLGLSKAGDGTIDALGDLIIAAAEELYQAETMGTAWRLGVSGGSRCLRERIIGGIESLPEAGAERAVVDGATNLEQEIGPSSRPAHLLRLVHPAVHQEVGGAFGDRGADPQSGPIPLGIIDQPVALSGEIAIQRVQGGP